MMTRRHSPNRYCVSIAVCSIYRYFTYISVTKVHTACIAKCCRYWYLYVVLLFSPRSLSADSGGGSGQLLAFLLQRPVDEEVEQDERHEGDQVDEHRHEGRDLQ